MAARALQGLGAAMVYGTSLALVAEALPGTRRGLAVGVVTMSASVASFLGVAFSAYAVEHLSWRWAFWIQVPLAVLALAATSRLPARAATERVLDVLRRLDWRGGLLLFGALTVATLSLDHVHEGEQSFGAGAHYHLPMHALALVLLLAFVRVESVVKNPLLRLRMLRDGRFAASIFANGVAHMSMLSAGFVIPFLLERGRGLPPSATRDTLVVMQLATVVCSVAAGWLYDRRPSPPLQWLTFGGVAGGLLAFGLVGGSLPYVAFVLTAAVLGASQGAFSTVNNTAVIAAADPSERGSAAGLLETTRHLGHSLGVSLSSGVLESLVVGVAVSELAGAYQAGFEQASLAMAALACLAVAGDLLVGAPAGPRHRLTPHDSLPRARGRAGAGGYLDSGVRLVAPGQQLLELPLVPRVVPAVDQLRRAVLDVLVEDAEVLRAGGAGPLDRLRVAPDLRAPLVEDGALARPLVRRAERVPLVRVLRGDPQRDLLAAPADQDRDRPVDRLRGRPSPSAP